MFQRLYACVTIGQNTDLQNAEDYILAINTTRNTRARFS